MLENPPPPGCGTADVIWPKIYEMGKRKRGKCERKRRKDKMEIEVKRVK
jgi:hypothetical protein